MAGFTLKLNDRGEVILVRGEQSVNLGPRGEASEELLRFLTEIDVVKGALVLAPCS